MAIPLSAAIETMSDKTWQRIKDILYAPISESAKAEFIESLSMVIDKKVKIDLTESQSASAQSILKDACTPIIIETAVCANNHLQGEDGEVRSAVDGAEWISLQEVAKREGWRPGTFSYHLKKYGWGNTKFGRCIYVNRKDYEGRPVDAKVPDITEEDVPLPFEDVIPPSNPEKESSDTPVEGIGVSEPAPADETLLQATTFLRAPHPEPTPRPHPYKSEIAVGFPPRTSDPKLGEEGVVEVNGEVYVTGPLGASCLRMSTNQFNKSATKGVPGGVKRHLERGRPELFLLADLKRSVYYSTSGRMGF